MFVAAQLLPAAADATCCPCCPMLTNIALSSSFRGRFEAPTTAGRVCTRTAPLGRFLAICFLRVETVSTIAFHSGCLRNSVHIFDFSQGSKALTSPVCVCVQLCIQEELPWVCWPLHTPPPRSCQATNEVKPLNSEMEGSGKSCCRKQGEIDI